MGKYKKMKIRSKNIDHAVKIEKKLKELGYKYYQGRYTTHEESNYFYTYDNGMMTIGHSESHYNKHENTEKKYKYLKKLKPIKSNPDSESKSVDITKEEIVGKAFQKTRNKAEKLVKEEDGALSILGCTVYPFSDWDIEEPIENNDGLFAMFIDDSNMATIQRLDNQEKESNFKYTENEDGSYNVELTFNTENTSNPVLEYLKKCSYVNSSQTKEEQIVKELKEAIDIQSAHIDRLCKKTTVPIIVNHHIDKRTGLNQALRIVQKILKT